MTSGVKVTQISRLSNPDLGHRSPSSWFWSLFQTSSSQWGLHPGVRGSLSAPRWVGSTTGTARHPTVSTTAHKRTLPSDFRMVHRTFRGEKSICNYLHLEINTEDFCMVLTYTELSRNATGVQIKGYYTLCSLEFYREWFTILENPINLSSTSPGIGVTHTTHLYLVGISGCYILRNSVYRFKHQTPSFCLLCSHAQAITA